MGAFPRILWSNKEMEKFCEEARKNGARVHSPFPGNMHVSWATGNDEVKGIQWEGEVTYQGLAIYDRGRDGVWTCTDPCGEMTFEWYNGTTESIA